MKVEQKNLFTGEFEEIKENHPFEYETELERLLLKPFLCPSCEEAFIEPEWEEFYDEDEDKTYTYYFHYCFHCQYKDTVDSAGRTVVPIWEVWEKERKAY